MSSKECARCLQYTHLSGARHAKTVSSLSCSSLMAQSLCHMSASGNGQCIRQQCAGWAAFHRAQHGCLAARRYSLKQLRAAVLAYARANFFLMHRTSLKGARYIL